MKRIALFLDGANCYHTQEKMGWRIDTKKLLNYCNLYGEIVEAVYYTGVSENKNQKRYLDKLNCDGYSLNTKPIKTIYDRNTGTYFHKGNMDVEITVDMLSMIDRYDVAILVSGDGDFNCVLQQLISKGKEVKIISTQCCVASDFVHSADIKYIDLCGIRDIVEYTSPSFALPNGVKSIPKVS